MTSPNFPPMDKTTDIVLCALAKNDPAVQTIARYSDAVHVQFHAAEHATTSDRWELVFRRLDETKLECFVDVLDGKGESLEVRPFFRRGKTLRTHIEQTAPKFGLDATPVLDFLDSLNRIAI